MNQFQVNVDGSVEQDKVFLCDRQLHILGEIFPVTDLKIDAHLDSNWECSFTVYKNNDGVTLPLWNKIKDLAVIYIEGKGFFEISDPLTSDNTDYKEVHGISLCEAEIEQAKTTIYFNTDENAQYTTNTITDADVNVIFYNPADEEKSMLNRLFREALPHYKIGHVDESLRMVKRTFSFENESVKDILNSIQEEIGCIFIFDNGRGNDPSTCRTVNVYTNVDRCIDCGSEDITYTCNTCGGHHVVDGVCADCGSEDITTTINHANDGEGTEINITLSNESTYAHTNAVSFEIDEVIREISNRELPLSAESISAEITQASARELDAEGNSKVAVNCTVTNVSSKVSNSKNTLEITFVANTDNDNAFKDNKSFAKVTYECTGTLKIKCRKTPVIQKAYGDYSGVFVERERLADSITLEGDKDSVKNYYKITGGDDVITNLLGYRLMDGNYIWKFSDDQLSDMSKDLQDGLKAREEKIAELQEEFNTAYSEYETNYKKAMYYQHEMMPSQGAESEENAVSIMNSIFGTNGTLTKCYAFPPSNTSEIADYLQKRIYNIAMLDIPSGYALEVNNVSYNSNEGKATFNAKIYNTSDYESRASGQKVYNDIYQKDNIVIPIKYITAEDAVTSATVGNTTQNVLSNDYYNYLKDELDRQIKKSEASDEYITFWGYGNNNKKPYDNTKDEIAEGCTANTYYNYDEEKNELNFPQTHYTRYCIERLQSFYDAYEACSAVLSSLDDKISQDGTELKDPAQGIVQNYLYYVDDSGKQQPINKDGHNRFLYKYNFFRDCIQKRIEYLEGIVDECNTAVDNALQTINTIKETVNMRNFLAEYAKKLAYEDTSALYNELLAYKREDTYNNSNYIADGLEVDTQFENVDNLVKKARKQLEDACELKYSITTTLDNLLTMREFKPLWDKFTLGNYLRVRVDGEIYKLKLISVSYDYTDLSHISVEFSNVEKTFNSVNSVSQVLQTAQNVASTYKRTMRQAKRGSVSQDTIQNTITSGLDSSQVNIDEGENRSYTLGSYGFVGRLYDEDSGTYSPTQIRITNNNLYYTTDNWKTVKTIIGTSKAAEKSSTTQYGILADSIVGTLEIGDKLTIGSENDGVVINKNGILITKGMMHLTDGAEKESHVLIDPNFLLSNENKDKHIIDVKSNGETVFYIDGKGNAYFKGAVEDGYTKEEVNSMIKGLGLNADAEGVSVAEDTGKLNWMTEAEAKEIADAIFE